jgi:hypothetical protein
MNDKKYRIYLQIQKFNQLFVLSSKTKNGGNKKLSLCLELLKLGK